ncbi:MAG: hypothetical protein QOK37_3161 [Thermoanaerobaculia bacterium]|jgi:tetratricopeptide (TPR) repeat protein|nr:hypothetical protein [Thermoanaerobaculia bacterium]
MNRFSIFLSVALLFPVLARGQSACAQLGVNCSHPTTPQHGANANNGDTASGSPTKENLEAKDLQEASDDENDKGVDSFKRRDWSAAIKHFQTALDYNPDNDAAGSNLRRAQVEAGNELARRERADRDAAIQEQTRQAQDQERKALETSQIAAIVRGIRGIKVPPPIPAEDAAITFGQIAPEDHMSKNIILGTEVGVAVIDVLGRIEKHPLSLTPTKLVFVVGKTFIDAENGADVYLVKQSDTYEKALRYLKDDATRRDFTAVVRAIKEQRPISENAHIELVRAAQAILDPKLGNSGKRIAWDAMFSPEARNAALTQICIELGGEIAGKTTEKAVARLTAERLPAFIEATEYLSKAEVALERISDSVARDSLKAAIDEANGMIAQSYHAVEVGSVGMGHIESIFLKRGEEERRERK